MKKIILALLLLSTNFSLLAATGANDETSLNTGNDAGLWWLNGGLGVGGATENSGRSGGLASYGSFNYQITPHQLLTARVSNINDIDFTSNISGSLTCHIIASNGGACSYSEKDGQQTDIGLMYGLIAKAKYGYISGSTGVAYVDGNDGELIINNKTVAGGNTYQTIGLPLEIQTFFTPSRYVGIGLVGFGDVNSKQSSYGAVVALQVGKLQQ